MFAIKLINHIVNVADKKIGTKNQHLTNVPQKCELEFIDLGLPSGTKWANQDSDVRYDCGCYNRYTEEVEGIPTKEQWKELRKECEWIWNDGFGYKVVGPNKNYIFLLVDEYAYRIHTRVYPVQVQKLKFIHPKEYIRKLGNTYDVILRKVQ